MAFTKKLEGEKMKVSIIMPCYNSEKYLDQAILSVLSQSFLDREFIIIDNGSTDNTRKIIESYEGSNLKLVSLNETIGNAERTINVGLSLAQGDYITWVSSDDYYSNKNSLLGMVDSLEARKVDMVSGKYKEICKKSEKVVGVIEGIITFDDMKKSNYIGGGFLFRRECFEKIGYMREDLMGASDWDYWIRLSKYFKIYKILNIVYCWRRHDNNMSANPKRIKEINENVRKVMNGDY